MRNKQNSNSGYMLLLLVIIGLVVIVTFIFGTNLFSSSKGGSLIERGTEAIDKARNAKENIENKYKFDPEAEEKKIDSLN